MATAMSYFAGYVLGFVRMIVSKRKRPRKIVDALAILTESFPDSMYVIVIALIAIMVQVHLNVTIPAFPEGTPSFVNTLIPALALGLPGGIYLQKAIYVDMMEQSSADYIKVAKATGASPVRIFIRQVTPNIHPIAFSFNASGSAFY
ncbi:hypothetical protein N007_08575 [Alicyclobacillus acidoterrestris ATCC 49025]|nr:hypothetical protein N007_08575 [Alicyclobacillus acidoterrestris ATCC 49025]